LYVSLVPIPPLPKHPVSSAAYQYQVPEVGEEFFFAIYRSGLNNSYILDFITTGSIPLHSCAYELGSLIMSLVHLKILAM